MTTEKKTILVVDDEPVLCELLSRALGQDLRVLTANSGFEAIELLDQEQIDAIIADYMMPQMTGVEVLVEAAKRFPNAPRILITASERIEHAQEAINIARISRFLAKPLRVRELRDVVLGAMREAELEEENQGLIVELQDKNSLLQRALSRVQEQERLLELKVEERTRELETAMRKLEDLALRDGLTGLYNHRYFQEALTTELARSARHSHVCGLIFIDVDHFKNYNDLSGHPAGDQVLREIAAILKNTGELAEVQIRGRVSDIAARYGGEEFVIILPETTKEGTRVRAERIRAAIEDYPFANRELQPGGRVTVSIGVSAFPADGMDKQEIIATADQALLRAKRQGRNRVELATGQDSRPSN